MTRIIALYTLELLYYYTIARYITTYLITSLKRQANTLLDSKLGPRNLISQTCVQNYKDLYR